MPIKSTVQYVMVHRHGKRGPTVTMEDGHRCDSETHTPAGWLDTESGEILDSIPDGVTRS